MQLFQNFSPTKTCPNNNSLNENNVKYVILCANVKATILVKVKQQISVTQGLQLSNL